MRARNRAIVAASTHVLVLLFAKELDSYHFSLTRVFFVLSVHRQYVQYPHGGVVLCCAVCVCMCGVCSLACTSWSDLAPLVPFIFLYQKKGNGGVFVAAFGGVLTIMGSTFTGNQAESGGVFSVQDSAALIVKDSNFEYNKALFYSGTITSGFGGGVVHMRRAATAQFTNCNFQGNQAASNGGVADVNDANTKIKFVDCILNANSAAIRGGAIHTRGPVPAPPTPVGGTVDIIGNCQITNNRARFGGAIDVRAAYVVTLTGASFGSMQVQGNLANSTQGDLGGFARVVDQGQLIIQNANIKDSVSKGAGGAIHLDSVTPFFMTNSIMEKNKANGNTVNRQKGDHIYGSAGTTFGNNVCGENIFITPSALGNGIVIFNVSVCGT